MKSFENKKILFFCPAFRKYDEAFYHPDNILVMSNNEFEISKEFLENPFVSVDLSNYSLEAFLTEILIDKQ